MQEIKIRWASLSADFLLSKALHVSVLFSCEVLSLPKSFSTPDLATLLCHLKNCECCLLQRHNPMLLQHWGCHSASGRSSPPSWLCVPPTCISGETHQWGKETADSLQNWRLCIPTNKQEMSVHSGLQPSLPLATVFVSHSFAKFLAQQDPIPKEGCKYKVGVKEILM